jgi:Domain of unknown function (DUF4258)
MLKEPLGNADVDKLLRAILPNGTVGFTEHVREQMANRGLSDRDVVNVLRGGRCDGCDLEDGTWRYRVRTQQIVVVIAFRSEMQLSVVTAWRMVK